MKYLPLHPSMLFSDPHTPRNLMCQNVYSVKTLVLPWKWSPTVYWVWVGFDNIHSNGGALLRLPCLNSLRAKRCRGKINIHLHFMSLLHVGMTQVIKILPQDQDLHILHSQYHGCWCAGDVRSQYISSHDIDLVKPRLLGLHTLLIVCWPIRPSMLHLSTGYFYWTRLVKPRSRKRNG